MCPQRFIMKTRSCAIIFQGASLLSLLLRPELVLSKETGGDHNLRGTEPTWVHYENPQVRTIPSLLHLHMPQPPLEREVYRVIGRAAHIV